LNNSNKEKLPLLLISIIMVWIHYILNTNRNIEAFVTLPIINMDVNIISILVAIGVVLVPIIIADIITKNNINSWKYIIVYVVAFSITSYIYYYLLNINVSGYTFGYIIFGIFLNEFMNRFLYNNRFSDFFSFFIIIVATYFE